MPRALFPEVAETRFGGPSAVGWLFAAISIGAVLGGLSSGWIGKVRRQGVALTVAIVGWGAAVALAGLGRTLWITVALLAVAGAADLVSAVLRQTILQVYAPDEMRGRLQGVFVVVVAGGPRLGDLRAGATAAVAGATFSWVAGGIVSVVLVLIAAALVPAFRHYDASAAREANPVRDPEEPLGGAEPELSRGPELEARLVEAGEPVEGSMEPMTADDAAFREAFKP
jgi:MFS family permease